MSDVKRRYTSTRRKEQAEATRLSITSAARRLFVERGYAATSIREIANLAEVAEPTIYATFGNKRSLLVAILDEIDSEADVDAMLEDIRAASGDYLRQLARICLFHRQLFERGADVYDAARQAGASDPELAELFRVGRDRARMGLARVIDHWMAAGVVRPTMSASDALARFVGLSTYELYQIFVTEFGWPPDKFETWLFETLAFTLFGESVASDVSIMTRMDDEQS